MSLPIAVADDANGAMQEPDSARAMTAVHSEGVDVDNPAEALARKAYATFVPRERNLSRDEINSTAIGSGQFGTRKS